MKSCDFQVGPQTPPCPASCSLPWSSALPDLPRRSLQSTAPPQFSPWPPGRLPSLVSDVACFQCVRRGALRAMAERSCALGELPRWGGPCPQPHYPSEATLQGDSAIHTGWITGQNIFVQCSELHSCTWWLQRVVAKKYKACTWRSAGGGGDFGV